MSRPQLRVVAGEQPSALDTAAEAFADGSHDALREIYDSTSRLVYTIALRKLSDATDAEDVTQQTYVSAWKSRKSFDPERGSIKTWILAITRRRIADMLESRSRHVRDVEAATRASVQAAPGADEVDRVLLADEVDDLGEPQRTIIMLAFYEGHAYAEVARRTGLPEGTVKSHVRRSLSKLRDRLEAADVAS